jgi:outer membrane protein
MLAMAWGWRGGWMDRANAGARGKCSRVVRGCARVWLIGVALAGTLAHAVEAPEPQPAAAADTGQHSTDVDRRVLARARALLNQNQARQAYEQLAPHEYDWAGDPEYDYLLGVAALASDQPEEAVMSLERAVAAAPGDAAARAALARAYYHSGDHELARQELESLGLRSLPRDRLFETDRYSAPIGTPGPRRRTFRYFVMLDTGYDSNANASPDRDGFLGVTLSSRNVEKDSVYGAVSNGGILRVPMGPYWDYDLRFNFVQRRNVSATFANTDRAGLSNEFVFRKNHTELNFGASLYAASLDNRFPYDGDYNHAGANLDFGARWFLGSSAWRLGTDVSLGAVRYDDSTRLFDVDQLLLDGTLEYVGRGSIPSFGLALLVGEAQAKKSESPYGRSLYGARYTSSWYVGRPSRMYLNVGMTRSNYDGRFFGENRHDYQYSAGLSAVVYVFPNRQWTLIPHVAQIVNRSDVALFDYNRTEIGLAFRWLSD